MCRAHAKHDFPPNKPTRGIESPMFTPPPPAQSGQARLQLTFRVGVVIERLAQPVPVRVGLARRRVVIARLRAVRRRLDAAMPGDALDGSGGGGGAQRLGTQ